MSFFWILVIFLWPVPTLNWVLLSQAAHSFKSILFVCSCFQNALSFSFSLWTEGRKCTGRVSDKFVSRAVICSAPAVVQHYWMQNLSVKHLLGQTNVFSLDSYIAEQWLTPGSLVFLTFCRCLYRCVLRQLLSQLSCPQRHVLPVVLHGQKKNKYFVLVNRSSFQEVFLPLSKRGMGENRACSHHACTSSVGTWAPMIKCNFTHIPVHLLGEHRTPSSVFSSLSDCSQLSNDVEQGCGSAEAPLPAGNAVQDFWPRPSK